MRGPQSTSLLGFQGGDTEEEMEEKKLKEITKARESWQKNCYRPSLKESPERLPRFSTVSDLEIEGLYTPEQIPQTDFSAGHRLPGQYPFTRGVQSSMYRGRLWTMRMFSGFGSAEDTNQRYKYLLSQGQTGLSVAFHYPTLMGYDSDSPQVPGRGRTMRGGHRHAERHGDSL